MKKLLLFLTALMTAVSINAQVLNAEPRQEAWSAGGAGASVMKASITPTSSQMWWGYYVTNEDIQFLGTNAAETYDCAIYIPAGHEYVGESTIKAMRIHVSKMSNISKAMVWISKTLPNDVSNADFVQNLTVKELSNGANDIKLKTPFEVNNEAIYVGYSFTIKRAEYCIPVGGSYVPNSLWLRSSSSMTSWQALNGYGKLALQLLLDGGNYPADMVTPKDFGPVVVGLGQTVDVPVDVVNNGKDDITSLSFTLTTNGVTSAEKTVTTPAISFMQTGTVNIPVEADATVGTTEKTLTITKVNGKENKADNKTAKGTVTTLEELKTWPRNVLIEEFTTEKCVYCPDAAAGLASFLTTYPDLAARVAVACHHDGYYTDWLTIPASTEYTWFYNDGGGTYAPAFMYDRYAWDGKTPVGSRESNAQGYKSRVEKRLEVTSYANITLAAEINAEQTAVSVTAYCERGWEFCATPPRLTVFLTEDNIKAHSQSGASGTFTHQHVLRAVNDTWGTELDWNGNYAEYSCTFKLDNTWKIGDLKVVAFIAPYDSSDPTQCVVENSAVVVPSVASGVNTMQNGDSAVETARFSLDGRRIVSPVKGMNIVRMADGTTRKVIR